MLDTEMLLDAMILDAGSDSVGNGAKPSWLEQYLLPLFIHFKTRIDAFKKRLIFIDTVF